MKPRLRLPLLMIALGTLACSTGCVKTETVFVPPTLPVRLGEDIHRAVVFVPDPSTGKLVRSTATLRAGTWITYDPAEWITPDGPTPATRSFTLP